MILEIDIGNTRLKWRIMDRQLCCIARGSAGYDVSFLTELYTEFREICVIRIASVGQQAFLDKVNELCQELWAIKPALAKVRKRYAGLEVVYQNPARLGVDRWLAMLAAYDSAGCAVCVIDCGTAITVDLVDDSGRQVGGYIVPGLLMQKTALLASTQLIKIESTAGSNNSHWGTSTEEAVSLGVLRQSSSFINAIVDEVVSGGMAPLFFITGGDAQTLMPMITSAELINYCPDLVMDGLKIAVPQ